VRELAEHEAKLAERAAKTAVTGKKPAAKHSASGRGALPTDQINLTDEESRISRSGRWLRAVLQRTGGGGGGTVCW